jgi:hypothetical protein
MLTRATRFRSRSAVVRRDGIAIRYRGPDGENLISTIIASERPLSTYRLNLMSANDIDLSSRSGTPYR